MLSAKSCTGFCNSDIYLIIDGGILEHHAVHHIQSLAFSCDIGTTMVSPQQADAVFQLQSSLSWRLVRPKLVLVENLLMLRWMSASDTKGAVIGKWKNHDLMMSVKTLVFAWSLLRLKSFAISLISDSDSYVAISWSIGQHGGKHNTGQHWYQDTALLHATEDRKRLKKSHHCPGLLLACHYEIVVLWRLLWTSLPGHDLP